MAEKIFIGAAWPYANGPLHLGHIAGAYLPADIFARYHRIKGDEVLMVSGSDQHGTPITIRAEQEGRSPAEISENYHQEFVSTWQKMDISFDIFTKTETENHKRIAQEFFLRLLEKGHIYKDYVLQPFCPRCRRSLPDRYVEGTCPICGYQEARGDQCDHCGQPLNPADLLNGHCKLCGTEPQYIQSEHFFLALSKFENELLEWVRGQRHWRPNVYNFTLKYLEGGLKDRAITRDINWGIPLPIPGYDEKRLYVWFEAVVGYLSASIEWANSTGQKDKWQEFWKGKCRHYYFIGKDNIPFHTIIWPVMLMGYGGLNLPYDVPANEYLTLEGRKLSTSHNWAIWLPDFLSRYDAEPLRYMLSVNMPETGDTDFSWSEFVRRNNDELVATYGNLAQRVLTFACRQFGYQVPHPSDLDQKDKEMLAEAEDTLLVSGRLLDACHFKQAIKTSMGLAQKANQYLEIKSPWKVVHEDGSSAATTIYVAIAVLSCLRTALYPFLPRSSQRLSDLLGFDGEVEKNGWQLHLPQPGQQLKPPEILFTKLDERIVHEELGLLEKNRMS